MTWLRDVAFLGVLLGGFAALGYGLLPRTKHAPVDRYDAAAYREPSFTATVDRVDAAFRTNWANQNLSATERASDLLVMRRLSLALVGTVPSLEEIRQFETLPEAERLPWWIDHLQTDPRSRAFLAERIARATVGTEDGPFLLFRRGRFTTWLGEELGKNTPYDAIVRELVSAKGIWTDRPSANFVTVTSNPETNNQPDPIRLAGRITRAFLGIRLDCAQCHNHPFAAWKQSDFQGLAAFFGQTHVGLTGVYDGEGDFKVEDKKSQQEVAVEPAVPFAKELLPSDGARRDRLAAWLTHPKNPYFARATVNRFWAIMFGRPLVAPLDNLDGDDASAEKTGTLSDRVLTILSDDFIEHGFDLRRLIRLIARTQAFQLDSAAPFELTEQHERHWTTFPMVRLRPEQVAGALLQAASVQTIDGSSHVVSRLIKFGQQNDFLKRYGDGTENEFDEHGGTIPQRLLMMNGQLVREKIAPNPFNASAQFAIMATTNAKAIEGAYLAVLTRRPTSEELRHFEDFLSETELNKQQKLEDIYWTLVNSTEFSWGH